MRNLRMMQILKNCQKYSDYADSQKEAFLGEITGPNHTIPIYKKGGKYIIHDRELNIAQAVAEIHKYVKTDMDWIREWLVNRGDHAKRNS